jgi:phytoene dehydrogenase-like protein
MKRQDYDVVVIGAGPNGLICTAYLARAGLKVALLERRHETGGGLETLELAGFKYNTHAIYHMMAEVMPPYRDFDLGSRGVKFVFPEVQCAYVGKGEKPIVFYLDRRRTVEALSTRFSSKDGERYERMHAEFEEFFNEILLPLTYVPPSPPIDQIQALEQAKGDVGKRFNRLSEMTPLEILEDYGFSDPLKGALYNLFSMWGLSNYDGVGFLFPLYVYRMTHAALCSGGSHRLSSALHKLILEAGGEICDLAEVARVELTNGRASGVLLKDGSTIRAKVVASTVDPKQSFIDFFDAGQIPADLVRNAELWEWEKTSLFGVHLGLKTAPQYVGSESAPDANRAMITFLGIHSTDEILDLFETVERGEVPELPHGHTTVASLFDPIQGWQDWHTGRWECLAPFGQDWDEMKTRYASRCLDLWQEHAPNLEFVDRRSMLVYPPSHIERKLKNMVRGSIKHGAYKSLQMGYNRPNDLCSRGSTPIEGYYVCGASTYPGGMIIGGPGYLGANLIAEELGATKTWEEIDAVKRARKAGIIPT